jgi:hypothetical protein
MVKQAKKLKVVEEPKLKIDLGCGTRVEEGFVGADINPIKGVKYVVDLGKKRWPWKDESVDEAIANHFLEHLDGFERMHFANELYRVLKPGAQCRIICPHWSGCRAYGDPTHKWPPMTEFWLFYLNRKWRLEQAPTMDASVWPIGFNCNFEFTWGFSPHPGLHSRAEDYRIFAMTNYRDAIMDLVATVTKH